MTIFFSFEVSGATPSAIATRIVVNIPSIDTEGDAAAAEGYRYIKEAVVGVPSIDTEGAATSTEGYGHVEDSRIEEWCHYSGTFTLQVGMEWALLSVSHHSNGLYLWTDFGYKWIRCVPNMLKQSPLLFEVFDILYLLNC